MRVSVRQQGGAFGIDREVEIADGKVRVSDRTGQQPATTLDAETTHQVEELAKVVRTATVTPAEGEVYDRMTTVIQIDDGESSHELVVRSADTAPPEVWKLVNLVKAAPTSASA
jgi:hypothetical protein